MFEHLWAKSSQNNQPGETLTNHLKRVANTVEKLYYRQPFLASLSNEPLLWHRAIIAALCHDLGKGAAGFQAMLRGKGQFPYRHEVLSAGFLLWLFSPNTCEDDLPWVAAAVLSHHKNLSEIILQYPEADPWLDPPLPDELEMVVSQIEDDFFETMPYFIREVILPILQQHPLVIKERVNFEYPKQISRQEFITSAREAIKAFQNLSHEISLQTYNSPLALQGRFMRGLLVLADHAGSAWESFRSCPALADAASMTKVLALKELYPHQHQAGETVGNTLLIAPTGSGKTQAALLWAANNVREKNVAPPVYYVLPYQASLNAMRLRLGRQLGDDKVVLQHARSLQALYRQLLEREYTPESAKALALKETTLAKLHVSPIRIVTPYQLLRGAFQLQGHEALWTDCAGGHFILDEIHAYDPHRLGMILAMLHHIVQDLSGKVLVMSATLPTVFQNLFNNLFDCQNVIMASPSTYKKFQRHRLHLKPGELVDEQVIQDMVQKVKTGLSVLVVATTVSRAQQIYEALKKLLPDVPLELLHGRFCPRDRFAKEQKLLATAATGQQKADPYVLVATQVVEVSLDVDFDVLYSDPAPLEALLQRFGRINRGCNHPERDVIVMTGIPEGSPVYDRLLVDQALTVLQKIDGCLIDEAAIQELLDFVYSNDIGLWWEKTVRKSLQDFQNRVLSVLFPFETDDCIERVFVELFNGEEVLPKGLLPDYETLLETVPLLSAELLVPVTAGQFNHLYRQKKIQKHKKNIWVADVDYNAQLGLQLNHRLLNQGI